MLHNVHQRRRKDSEWAYLLHLRKSNDAVRVGGAQCRIRVELRHGEYDDPSSYRRKYKEGHDQDKLAQQKSSHYYRPQLRTHG